MPSDDDDRPTAFSLHNNEPELIDYFASPLGISKSICPAGEELKRGRTSSKHLRKQMLPGISILFHFSIP